MGGKKQGAGKFWWPDGSMYSGQFKENEIDGVGVYTWSPAGGLAIVDVVR